MIGRTTHTASAETSVSTTDGWQTRNPYVFLSNEGDGHYWQGFENWAELSAFIAQVQAAGVEAFGEPPTLVERPTK